MLNNKLPVGFVVLLLVMILSGWKHLFQPAPLQDNKNQLGIFEARMILIGQLLNVPVMKYAVL